MSVVSPEAFRDWIAPNVAAIGDFATAIDSLPDRHGWLPSAASRAMSELAEEHGYRARCAWEQPVTDTHMFGGATLRAASDYVRGIAGLFGGDHPPLYAHLTLARDALESAVVSAWLSESELTSGERIKRGLRELLYSANEVGPLALDPKGLERVEFWKQVGASLGWTIDNSRPKPIIDGTRRPRISTGIVELASSGTDARVGDLLYSRLSAVDHVTWFGLFSAFDSGSARRDEQTGMATVPITIDAAAVSAYAYYVVTGVHAAAVARFTLMGWLDEPWHEAAAHADTLERHSLEIALARR